MLGHWTTTGRCGCTNGWKDFNMHRHTLLTCPLVIDAQAANFVQVGQASCICQAGIRTGCGETLSTKKATHVCSRCWRAQRVSMFVRVFIVKTYHAWNVLSLITQKLGYSLRFPRGKFQTGRSGSRSRH